MILLTALTLAMAVLLLICVLALMDQYRTLELVRDKFGINAQPAAISRPDRAPDLVSLGVQKHPIPAERDFLVLFLSTTCNSCTDVAMFLADNPSDRIVTVVRAPSREEVITWCGRAGLSIDLVHADIDGSVGAAFRVNVNPSVFLLQGDEIVLAQTVPTPHQLAPLLEGSGTTSALRAMAPTGGDRP